MTIDPHDEESSLDDSAPPSHARRRAAFFLMLLLVVLIFAFIPPLINVSRLQRRVDTSISATLGRPVHFDRLSLNLLPVPGFTLENFVVEEDPAFGYEPTLHANEVRINLRLSSLWRRRIELSSISFSDPSVNLVHSSDGRWNLQGLLLQASRISAAPTAQVHAGPAPRFPYIEASGARVNLKLDQEKTPVSLTEADFALWQPAEHQWRLRIEARPQRTDITPGESGTLHIEGTLGGDDDHSTLDAMPIDLHASWQDAQLGGLTSLLLGRDAGLRGDLTATLAMLGTIERNTIRATLNINNARRADFMPPHPLSLSVGCRATAENSFHAFPSIECRLPPSASSAQAMLALAADVPDVRQPKLSTIRVDVPALPAQTLYDWLGVATPHPPTAFVGKGTLTGALQWGTQSSGESAVNASRMAVAATTNPPSPVWTGELRLTGEWLKLAHDSAPLDDVVLRSTQSAPPASSHHISAPGTAQPAHDSFDLSPVSLSLGGGHSAMLTGYVDDSGYSLHLSGPVVLDQLFDLGAAIPQFGDGLRKLLAPEDASASQGSRKSNTAESSSPAAHGPGAAESPTSAPPVPVSVDLTAARTWGSAQTWTQASPAQTTPPHRTR